MIHQNGLIDQPIDEIEHPMSLQDTIKAKQSNPRLSAGFERIDAREKLQTYIDSGDFQPGDRLPAERQLIEDLGVTRAMLRKGLDALERDGAIWRHVGKGTFIASPHTTESPIPQLTTISQQVTPMQMMRARLSLEPAITREAAANASAENVLQLQAAHQRSLEATSWKAYEICDDDFHRSLAEATGNILLQSLFDHLNQVRRAVGWAQVIRHTERPPADHSSFVEHTAILHAIEARDPIAAHTAMREHLHSVAKRVFGDI